MYIFDSVNFNHLLTDIIIQLNGCENVIHKIL